MNQYSKDIIDAVSKIAGVLGLFVATFGALFSVKKNRDERRTSAEKDREQRERQLVETKVQAEKDREQKDLQLQQMELNRKVDEARFWLELRRMFGEYSDVHLKLRGGEWQGPQTNEEWASVEGYMGLFEHCSRMLEDKLIGLETFKSLYGYRVDNILNNQLIVTKKLLERKEYWKDFIRLVVVMGREFPPRQSGII